MYISVWNEFSCLIPITQKSRVVKNEADNKKKKPTDKKQTSTNNKSRNQIVCPPEIKISGYLRLAYKITLFKFET